MFQDVIGGPNSQQIDVDGIYVSLRWVIEIKPLQEIFNEIDYPVIVEGESDKSALEEYGLQDIIPLNGKPLFKVASSISKKAEKVLVLTDFDQEGEKLSKKLNSFLVSFGVVPKNKLRGKIKKIVTREGVSEIENLKPKDI